MVLSVSADKEEWARRHAEHIAAEVLATEFTVTTDSLEGNPLTVHEVVKGATATVAKQ